MTARIVKLEGQQKANLVVQRVLCQVQDTSGPTPLDGFVDRDVVLDVGRAGSFGAVVRLWARHDHPARTTQKLYLRLEDAPDLCEDSFEEMADVSFDLCTAVSFPATLQEVVTVNPLRRYVRHKLLQCKDGGSTCSALVAYDLFMICTE